MPGPGDHHRLIENPFAENAPRISEYTAQEIATLQSRLDRQLGPEYISSRAGPGGSKVHYLAAEKVINLANEVFGFNGWSSSIQNVQIDFVDDDHGKITLGCSIICRVTLRDGTFHEDIGYGEIRNAPSKSAAFEKAKKEAATDALKRALRNFGNVLGNCLYDKSYLAKVTKVKVEPSRWGVEDLHRHPSYGFPKKDTYATLPSETRHSKDPQPPTRNISQRPQTPNTGNEYDDEFGQIEDDDLMGPDEICLKEETNNGSGNGQSSELTSNAPPSAAIQGPGPPDGRYVPRQQSMPSLRSQQAAAEPLGQGQGQRLQNAPHRPTAPNAPYAPNGPTRPMNNGSRGPPDLNQMARGQPDMAPIPHSNVPNGSRVQPPRPLPSAEPLQRPQPQPQPTRAQDSAEQPQRPAQNQPQPQPSRPLPSVELLQRTPQNQPHSAEHAIENGAPLNHEPAVGFYNARAAEVLAKVDPSNGPLPATVPAFNPHADGGIRRTSGVNHNRSGPVSRQAVVGATGQNGGHPGPGINQTPSRPNFVNPQSDTNRRIGMPGGMQSPLANRGAYKPPGPSLGKRDPEPLTRPPLANVSNIQAAAATEGIEFKRPRIEETNPQTGSNA